MPVPELEGVPLLLGVPLLDGVPLLLGVPELEGVPVLLDVTDRLGVTLGVLLSLGHVAPTQQTEPDRLPPDPHSQDAQHAPGLHPPLDSASKRPAGTLHVPQ